MKENKQEKDRSLESGQPAGDGNRSRMNREKLKKPLVFAVMAILFIACLYLIFGGDSEKENTEAVTIGINDAVPQATEDTLPSDKGKAYEQEILREKERAKREALMTLSDYWHADTTASATKEPDLMEEAHDAPTEGRAANPALGSYRNMQRSLSSFYRENPEQETLRKENERLREQLGQESQPRNGTLDRLQLMEKSYQMAAKYFPGTAGSKDSIGKNGKEVENHNYLEVLPAKQSVVSRLVQNFPDSLALQKLALAAQSNFHTAGKPAPMVQPANSLRACVHQSVKITGEGSVQLRLLQPARLGGATLPAGFIVTATAKFQTSRLQLQVVSLEVNGRIVPVDLSAYDLDGQKGLNLPYAPEVTAVNGTLANMGNAAGGGFTINRNAGQQLTSDATRGLLQGISGYFSKMVKPQKANLNAGYQVFLVSKDK